MPWLAVSNAIGPSLIVVSFADDRDHAGHRRWRITRRADECHGVKEIRTVIAHARELGLAAALAASPLVVAMIEPPFG
jgi:adenylate kinase